MRKCGHTSEYSKGPLGNFPNQPLRNVPQTSDWDVPWTSFQDVPRTSDWDVPRISDQTGSLGDYLGTLEGNVLGKSWGPIFAGWVNTCQLLAQPRKQIVKCINEIEETTFADNDYVLILFSTKIKFSSKKKEILQKKLL